MSIATRCGQDSDCNPSSAVGVLGVMRGYRAIPEQLKKGIPEMANRKFQYTDYSFNTIVKSTYEHALEAVTRNGGKVDVVKLQQPKAPKLEALERLWFTSGANFRDR